MSASILPGRLEGLTYEVGGRRLIDGLTLAIEAGPRTLILGPNGAGKSLTLRLAHGLIRPSAGRVTWHSARAQRRQALVFQRPVMLRRSAADNVDYALALRGVNGAERARRREAVLARTGLSELAERPARVLSGGEQQRLALARAWVIEPEVLFLDEPTANLDPSASRSVEAIVNAIHEAGTKIVMTTHDLGQAKRLADEIVFLHRGRLIERAPVGPFFDTPGTPEARAFLAGDPL